MVRHEEIEDRDLRSRIRNGSIQLGGNRKLKIYGLLNCKSGKRMKRQNRFFFTNKIEAERLGFRPCGHCMREDYLNWKHGLIQGS